MSTASTPPQFTTPAPTLDDLWRYLQQSSIAFDERMEKSKVEADKRAAEADKRAAELEKQMKELAKQLGGHANRLGEFVQEMVRPAVVRLFKERNLPVHQVAGNVEAEGEDGQSGIEIDLLVVNTDTLIAVECKSKLTQDDVDEHLERLAQFKHYFPKYVGYTVLGAVAGMVIAKEVSRYAHKKGLFVLAQSGETIEIRNPSAFEPKAW